MSNEEDKYRKRAIELSNQFFAESDKFRKLAIEVEEDIKSYTAKQQRFANGEQSSNCVKFDVEKDFNDEIKNTVGRNNDQTLRVKYYFEFDSMDNGIFIFWEYENKDIDTKEYDNLAKMISDYIYLRNKPYQQQDGNKYVFLKTLAFDKYDIEQYNSISDYNKKQDMLSKKVTETYKRSIRNFPRNFRLISQELKK